MFKSLFRRKAVPDAAKQKASRQKKGLFRTIGEVWDKTLRMIGGFVLITASVGLLVTTGIVLAQNEIAEAETATATRVFAEAKKKEVEFRLQNRMTSALAAEDNGKRPASSKKARRSDRRS